MSWKTMMMAMAVVDADPQLGNDGTTTEVTPADAEAIRMMIRAQLSAFRAGNAERAFELSSENLRGTFGEPERLLAVIQKNYQALADPKQVWFGDIVITPDGLGQTMEVMDAEGYNHHALYLVEHEDGVWVSNGCLMVPQGAISAEEEPELPVAA